MTYPPQSPQYSSPQNQAYNPNIHGTNYAPQIPVSNPEPPLNQPWYEADFMGAFKRFWKKYATFSGRASRAEFWWAYLANTAITILLTFLCFIIIGFILLPVYALAVVVPTIAIMVRRLHDSNLPGWWVAVVYGGSILGSLITSVGTLLPVFNGSYRDYDPYGDSFYSYPELSGGSIALWVIGGLISLAALGVMIYLMVRPTDPQGARFDEPPAQQFYGMAPNYAAEPQTAMYPADTYTQAAPEAVPAPAATFAPEATLTPTSEPVADSAWQPEATPSPEPLTEPVAEPESAMVAEPVVEPETVAKPTATYNVSLHANAPTVEATAENENPGDNLSQPNV